jgi:glycosyltransferase involved in cell wall biosynthesis
MHTRNQAGVDTNLIAQESQEPGRTRTAGLRIIALMAVHNESDMLAETLSHTISQGLDVIVLDNGSTDDSADIARSYLDRGVLTVRTVITDTYCWAYLLDTLCEWGWEFSADWCALVDADTLLEAPEPTVSLRTAIEQQAARGFNVVRFNNFEFWPTDLDSPSSASVRQRLTYYTFNDNRQEKCWLHKAGVGISREGGHVVDFPSDMEKRLSPDLFTMRHYKFRSYEQGVRKVFNERLPRFRGEPSGWHTQYDWLSPARDCFVRDSALLNKYLEDGRWVLRPALNRDGRPL